MFLGIGIISNGLPWLSMYSTRPVGPVVQGLRTTENLKIWLFRGLFWIFSAWRWFLKSLFEGLGMALDDSRGIRMLHIDLKCLSRLILYLSNSTSQHLWRPSHVRSWVFRMAVHDLGNWDAPDEVCYSGTRLTTSMYYILQICYFGLIRTFSIPVIFLLRKESGGLLGGLGAFAWLKMLDTSYFVYFKINLEIA